MQMTVTIDDELYARALEYADPSLDQGDLISEALRNFIRSQAARRLADLGGAAPEMEDVARRGRDGE